MKHAVSLIAATVALGAVAVAQTPPATPAAPPAPAAAPAAPIPPSACGELPAKPTLPEPGTVTAAAQMKDLTDNTVNKWISDARPILTCRQNEANALAAELRAKQAQWDARRAEFSAAQASVTDLGAQWQSEIDAFNQRNQAKSNRGNTGRSSR
jgi:hypothetical protein